GCGGGLRGRRVECDRRAAPVRPRAVGRAVRRRGGRARSRFGQARRLARARPAGRAAWLALVPLADRRRPGERGALDQRRARLSRRRTGAVAPSRSGPSEAALRDRRRGFAGLPGARAQRGHPLRAGVGARGGGAAQAAAARFRRRQSLRPRRQGPGNDSRGAEMSRLSDAFPKGRTALVCYVMGGDGDTAGLLQAVDEAGADVIELGLPFSDPIADGPVLQAAATRALASGATVRGVIELAGQLRLRAPVVAVGYMNPVESMGAQTFARALKQAGLCGAIIPDLP